MATRSRNRAFKNVVEEKPTLHELCEHVKLGTKWYQFGVLLKLDVKSLNAIDEQNREVNQKVIKMFELWLNSSTNATRREVLETLRKDVIGEMVVAENYEKILRDITRECICNECYYACI